MGRHSKIVIGAPDSDFFFNSPGELPSVREPLGFAKHALEDPVRVVLFLFGDLLKEEIFVVKEFYRF